MLLQMTSRIFCFIVISCVVALIMFLSQTVFNSMIPFDGDEAAHAIDGWEVSYSFRQQGWHERFQALSRQSFYPPIHSFFIAATYQLFEPNLATTRLPSVINYLLVLGILTRLTFQITRAVRRSESRATLTLSYLSSLFVCLLVLTSQVFITNAILTMLEMTGALLAVLLLVAMTQIEQLSGKLRYLGIVICALLAMLNFLTKYSFGVFLGIGLTLALLSETWPRRLGIRARREAVLVISICAIITTSWVLFTDRETMLLFLTDHPGYVDFWTLDNLLYYYRVWLNHYSLTPALGLLIFALFGVGTYTFWHLLTVRFVFWSTLAASLILLISTTNLPRHFLVVAPGIWLVAGLGLFQLVRKIVALPRGEILTTLMFGCGFVYIAFYIAQALPQLPDRLNEALEGEPIFSAMQHYSLSQVDLMQPILFVGDLDDQNNLLAIRWRAAILTGRSTSDIEIDFFPFEEFENSLYRSNRKPQIASVDPDFPRMPFSAILDRQYYDDVIEIRRIGATPLEVHYNLQEYLYTEKYFEKWVVTIYDVSRSALAP